MKEPIRMIRMWKLYADFRHNDPERQSSKSYIHRQAGMMRLMGAKNSEPANPRM
jgi:hypothetical protein